MVSDGVTVTQQVPSVVIIGGGPAGSTLGALLAKEGVDVTILEKARFPRPHIGEALQPAAFELLDFHLGLGPKMAKEGFVKKFGALYYWGESRELWSVLFDDRLDEDLETLTTETIQDGGYDFSYQVDRGRFDHILLMEAESRGAKVLQETEVVRPLLNGQAVTGVLIREKGKEPEELHADLVVDASGQRCVLGRAFRLTKDIPDLQATATYGYFKGKAGVDTALGRNVQLVVTVPEGWVWWIPVSDDLTSVGVVTSERKKMTEKEFLELVERAQVPMEGCELTSGPAGPGLVHAKDWSYTHRRFVGTGWMMVGDAACFTDPILSGGVDFAIRGACNASIAILRMFGEGGTAHMEPLLRFQEQLQREFTAYLRLARYWYANNRSVDGLFWEVHKIIPEDSLSTPIRAFKYVTSGKLDTDAHFRIFTDAQEKKMFRALGVDKEQVRSSLERAKKRLKMAGIGKDGKVTERQTTSS